MNIIKDLNEITRDQFVLIKCELCDDHIKRRYLEMKEHFFKIFKNYIKLLKLIKNKDEINIKKTVDEIKSSQKDFLTYRTLIEKLVLFRKISRNNSDYSKIKIQGLGEFNMVNIYTHHLLWRAEQRNLLTLLIRGPEGTV